VLGLGLGLSLRLRLRYLLQRMLVELLIHGANLVLRSCSGMVVHEVGSLLEILLRMLSGLVR
jgi:hypothetical protein